MDRDMYYAAFSICSPTSKRAGEICQKIADTIPVCGYPDCSKKTVGAAVHETVIGTKEGYKNGSAFLPVCEDHKKWEFAKLEVDHGW
jgi:hypothetical protein